MGQQPSGYSFKLGDCRVPDSISETTDFLTNSSGNELRMPVNPCSPSCINLYQLAIWLAGVRRCIIAPHRDAGIRHTSSAAVEFRTQKQFNSILNFKRELTMLPLKFLTEPMDVSKGTRSVNIQPTFRRPSMAAIEFTALSSSSTSSMLDLLLTFEQLNLNLFIRYWACM